MNETKDNWHTKHKADILKTKKKRYKEDSEYRERIRLRAKQVNDLKRDFVDGHLVHTAIYKGRKYQFFKAGRMTAEANISRGVLATLIRNKIIPEVYMHGKHKLFTKQQIKLVKWIVKNKDKKSKEQLIDFVTKRWWI